MGQAGSLLKGMGRSGGVRGVQTQLSTTPSPPDWLTARARAWTRWEDGDQPRAACPQLALLRVCYEARPLLKFRLNLDAFLPPSGSPAAQPAPDVSVDHLLWPILGGKSDVLSCTARNCAKKVKSRERRSWGTGIGQGLAWLLAWLQAQQRDKPFHELHQSPHTLAGPHHCAAAPGSGRAGAGPVEGPRKS